MGEMGRKRGMGTVPLADRLPDMLVITCMWILLMTLDSHLTGPTRLSWIRPRHSALDKETLLAVALMASPHL